MEKKIYLKREENAPIIGYVVDYLLNIETNKKYVIVTNRAGANAKGFELVGDSAIILSKDEVSIFSGYQTNPNFRKITALYEDEFTCMLKKRESELSSSGTSENKAEESVEPKENLVIEEPMDVNEVEHIEKENIEEVKKIEPIENFIIIYVYDQNVIKKYKAFLDKKQEDQIFVSSVKFIESLNGAKDIDIEKFMSNSSFESNAYFVNYEDYDASVTVENGKTIVNAIIKPYERKKTIATEQEDTIVVFDSTSFKKNTILGSICIKKSSSPFTFVPIHEKLNSIQFTYEAKTMEDICQEYQNLYPTLHVYLVRKPIQVEKEYILHPDEYSSFRPSEKKKRSLLSSGKKVLTTEEMIENRKQELKQLQKKSEEKKAYFQTKVADQYLKDHPDQFAFANYLRTLELAGMTEEHMRASGLLENKKSSQKSKKR